MRGDSIKITLAVVVAAALAGAIAGAVAGFSLAGGSGGSSPTVSGSAERAAATVPKAPAVNVVARSDLSPEELYRRDAPSVVVITATDTQVVPPTFFSPPTKERVGVLGSGFVVDRQGDILTNDHVVHGGTAIRVGFSSGASYPAKVIGADPSTDVAVVRVQAPARALHPLAFDDSADISVGDAAYAIGNPFGLDRTMTAGIVSAVGRSIQAPNGLTIPNAIQTDAPINHGNSGGPLLDRFGRVIGINDQIQGGTVDANVGIGFAVPSDTARSVGEQLIKSGHVEHAWLGVEAETLDPMLSGVVRGLPARGVIVAKVVADGPAAKAGLKAGARQVTVDGETVPAGGDVIVSVDGRSVTTSQQLGAAVAGHRPGDRVELGVSRNGVRRTVAVTLGDVPARTS
jgi:S1-C subfamily serine protease